LFAWRTNGRPDGVIAWESSHHDNANTGDATRKLAQGTTKRAAAPLDCTLPVAPLLESYEAGGCAVAFPRSDRRFPLAFAASLALLTALGVVRRRSPCKTGPG